MDLDNIVADLNFVSSMIHNIEADCHIKKIEDVAQRRFGIDFKCDKPIENDKAKIGNLLLIVEVIINDNKENTDHIKFTVEGKFSSSNSLSDEEFLTLLNINGAAALYSIARAKFEVISGLIYPDGKFVLPMINILKYYEEKNKIKNKNKLEQQ